MFLECGVGRQHLKQCDSSRSHLETSGAFLLVAAVAMLVLSGGRPGMLNLL